MSSRKRGRGKVNLSPEGSELRPKGRRIFGFTVWGSTLWHATLIDFDFGTFFGLASLPQSILTPFCIGVATLIDFGPFFIRVAALIDFDTLVGLGY